MQEPGGCTPKKRRRRSLRNLRRQSIPAFGEDWDASLLVGGSAVQDPAAAEADDEYGSLWLELDSLDAKPRARMKGSKRTGRRSSFGIVQDGHPVLPLWDQPAPYLPQPEAVRFARSAAEASPQVSPAFQVDRAGPWKNEHYEDDVHDTSLNTAFSKFNIRSDDPDGLGEMQMRETGDSLSLPYSNPEAGGSDFEGPEQSWSPSPVPCDDLQAPGRTAEDDSIQSPGEVPPALSDISEWERWQRVNQNSPSTSQDYASPQNRSSFLTKLSSNFREVTHGVESSPLTTLPSSHAKAHLPSDLSPGGLSTSSVETPPRVHREQKNTADTQSGKHIISESEPEVAVNFDSLKLDTSAGSVDEEQGEGNVDFDLIFDSPCLDQGKCAKGDSPLRCAQPANQLHNPEDSSTPRSKTLPPSGVTATGSPLAVPLTSSPESSGRSSSLESQGMKADEGGDEGKMDEPAASTVIEKPRQLRKSRRSMDLTQVPEMLEAPMMSDTQAPRETPPAASWDSAPSQSPGTERRTFIRGRRRSGSLAPLVESADEKSDAESAGSTGLQAGLEGDSSTIPAASSLSNIPREGAPPTASGAGRYQKRKRASTDLRLVPRKTGSDRKQGTTITDADGGPEFHQGCDSDMAEGRAETDAGLSEVEGLAVEGTSAQSGSWSEGAGSAGRKQPKKRKRELLEILAAKENMDTDSPEVDEEMANLNEGRARRRRRRSFSIPQASSPGESADVAMAEVGEEDTAVRVAVRRGRARELGEKELEDLYRNKNYKLPELRTWETIFETQEEEESSETEPVLSKRRYKRFLTFSDKDPVKARKRMNKAIKKGWTPRKKLKVTNIDVQLRLDRLEASLKRAEEDIW